MIYQFGVLAELLLRFLLIIQRVQQFVVERRGAWTWTGELCF
jgi:hypothetical protein